jgi:hypothetical protein
MRIKQLLESATTGGTSTASVATVAKGSKGMIKRQKPTDNALDKGKLFQETNAAEGKDDKIAQLKKDHDTAVHWSKNEKSPQKREAARQKAEKIKRHLETQYKQGVAEVAPPGDKAERMVKHIKKGYAKDGKITPKEKSIAYATAWKAHNADKVEEQSVEENKKGVRAVKHAVKPRNFVAKNAVQSGAGAHKDKKKAQKQGDVKHKAKEPAYESRLQAALDRRIIR